MTRALGVVAVYLGTMIVGFNPNRGDAVILVLPRGGHGIHVTDVLGLAVVTVGVVTLLRSTRRQ